jgi:hypothetical protein
MDHVFDTFLALSANTDDTLVACGGVWSVIGRSAPTTTSLFCLAWRLRQQHGRALLVVGVEKVGPPPRDIPINLAGFGA